jgi:hypothetical protein
MNRERISRRLRRVRRRLIGYWRRVEDFFENW